MVRSQLYKQTATGAIQVWYGELDRNRYRTMSGQLNGEIVVSNWTTCKGKNIGRANETTPEEQASSELDAHYAKKMKAGYKISLAEAESGADFRPMLAYPWDKYIEKLMFPHIVQPKLDGVRCLVRGGQLMSRANTPIMACPHILEELSPILSEYPDLIIDGELYNHEFREDFNQIVSLTRKTKLSAEDREASRIHIQYWVYDLVADEPYVERMDFLLGLLEGIEGVAVLPTPTEFVQDLEELDAEYNECLESGFEGMMLRDPAASYEQKRSRSLLKRKDMMDAEYTVVAIYEGKGNRSGMAGGAVVRLQDGSTCKANIVGDRDHLRKVLANRKDYVGSPATVEYQGITPAGALRFPRVKEFYPGGRDR